MITSQQIYTGELGKEEGFWSVLQTATTNIS